MTGQTIEKLARQRVGVSVMLLICMTLFFCKTAQAADAVRIYLELSGKTAIAWPGGGTDYLRGRVVLLDANNELATTFGGKSITDTQLLFQSNRFGADVRFSRRPVTDLDLTGDWETGAESVAFRVEKAWQEFAVSYDNIKEIDNDTLVLTLKAGATQITSQRAISVLGPPANCYVARTGGLVALDLLDEIPARKNDGGSIKTAGASTVVDVYAAFFNSLNGKYYYTNNLPEGGESVALSSPSTAATLVNGHYQTSLTPSISSTDDNATALNREYTSGKSSSFSAGTSLTTTRWVGTESGDVTSDEYINVTKTSTPLTGISSSFTSDTSIYKPNRIVNKITIVGLPVNEVTSAGAHKYAGLGGEKNPPAELPVTPNDAYGLLADKTAKPSLFKVPGKLNQTCIYGAIVGYDKDDNPAPFTPGYKTVFYLKKKGGSLVNSSGTELAAVRGNGSASLFSGSAIDTKITTTYAYQAFLPFKITATAVDGTTPSLDKLYISEIKLWNGSSFTGSVDTSVYDNINEEAEGVSFIAQDTVGAITLTDITNLDQKKAGDDAEVQIKGKNGETSFGLRVVHFDGDSTVTNVGVGNKGSSSEIKSPEEILIAGGGDTAATKDVSFFTAVYATASRPFFFIFTGFDKSTNVIQQYPPTGASDEISILAADPDDFALSSLSTNLSGINAYLDAEQEHNTVAIAKGVVEAKDLFSNAYGATGVSLEESALSANLYLPVADGTASDTEFPGASVKIDENVVLVKYGLSSITSAQSTGILKFTSKDGALSTQITMNVKAPRETGLKSKFVPVPGITDTPVEVFIADQNGAQIAPVTITAANDATGNNGRYGNTVEAELTVDNGTLANISNDIVSLTTKSPCAIITAQPDIGKDSMLIEAETRRYGKGTLLLSFIPDFEKPVVADIIEGNCRIDIEITDNQAVDLEGTDVTIISPAGEIITGTLSRTNIYDDNNTSGAITFTGFPKTEEGTSTNYSAGIIARDQWGNEREVSRIFAIECVDIPTECLEVDPAYGIKGETKTVTIKAENTNFAQGTTQVSFSCDNATVTGTEVKSPTEVVVTVAIGGTAPPVSSDIAIIMPSLAQEASGTTTTTTATTTTPSTSEICDISVTTGAETLVCSGAFEILAEPLNPECLALTPSVITSGQTTDIVITGADTKFTDTTAVSFDCPDITVNSKTADSDTQLTVNISSGAVETTTTCNVTVGDLECGQLTLQPSSSQCRLTAISRTGVRAGYLLPRIFLAVISGNSDCSFSRSAAVSFGTPSITATPLLALRNRLVCLVTVMARAPQGAYEVTVDGIGGVTFTVR